MSVNHPDIIILFEHHKLSIILRTQDSCQQLLFLIERFSSLSIELSRIAKPIDITQTRRRSSSSARVVFHDQPSVMERYSWKVYAAGVYFISMRSGELGIPDDQRYKGD